MQALFFFFCAMWGGAILPRPRHLAMVCVRSSTAATVVAATAAIAATTIVAATAAPVSAATAAAQDDQDDDDPQAAAAAPTATVKPHNEVPPDLEMSDRRWRPHSILCIRYGLVRRFKNFDLVQTGDRYARPDLTDRIWVQGAGALQTGQQSSPLLVRSVQGEV